ncbi:MAG TPA: ISL3 family transposase [Terriglobales bacterium]|nr:ISL3 family transposase [Terriglobales bacterium]
MANALVPEPKEVRLCAVKHQDGGILVRLAGRREVAACPRCGAASGRVHSRYQRRLQDLSWSGVPVALELNSRRFFCDQRDCPQRVFAEPFEGTAPRYARRSARAQNMLGRLGVALGGEGGARAAARLGVGASGDTVLRTLRRMDVPPHSPPRILGIDDWAWRRGQRYGTTLVDLESRRPVDLLPDRSAESSAAWLRGQPQIEVVSRDRAQVYADAARRGAPQAEQVADRFHLLRNLREALEVVVRTVHLRPEPQTAEAGPSPAPPAAESPPAGASTPSRQRRQQRYERVVDLLRQGRPRRRIAAELALDVRTVRRWLRAGGFPERAATRRGSHLEAWAREVEVRARSNEASASRIWRELRTQGFTGSESNFRRWFAKRFPQLGRRRSPAPPPSAHPPSPRLLSALLLGIVRSPRLEDEAYLTRLCLAAPELESCRDLAHRFRQMLTQHDDRPWDEWLLALQQSRLRRFAASLRTDEAAVRAAISSPWSNGPVEGAVHRLKLIKRQMYGRGKLDLLRIRVLRAS